MTDADGFIQGPVDDILFVPPCPPGGKMLFNENSLLKFIVNDDFCVEITFGTPLTDLYQSKRHTLLGPSGSGKVTFLERVKGGEKIHMGPNERICYSYNFPNAPWTDTCKDHSAGHKGALTCLCCQDPEGGPHHPMGDCQAAMSTYAPIAPKPDWATAPVSQKFITPHIPKSSQSRATVPSSGGGGGYGGGRGGYGNGRPRQTRPRHDRSYQPHRYWGSGADGAGNGRHGRKRNRAEYEQRPRPSGNNNNNNNNSR